MDGTEDSSYLTLLNDGTHNYLLQTTEEALGVQDPSLNVEPMFTEIEDGSGAWSVGLPILMNGNLISEVVDQGLETSISLPTNNNHEETAMDIPTGLSEIYENSLQNGNITLTEEGTEAQSQMKYPIEIPGKGFITADGLFITNDLLLQLKLGENLNLTEENSDVTTKIIGEPLTHHIDEQEDILINPKTLIPHNENVLGDVNMSEYNSMNDQDATNEQVQQKLINESSDANLNTVNGCTENEQVFDVEHLSTSGDIIRLLNTDGTVINISKEQLLNYNGCKDTGLEAQEKLTEEFIENDDDIFDMIMAHKCKKCSFLCEERNDMLQHWKNEHALAVKTLIQNEQREETSSCNENKLKAPERKNGIIKYNHVNGEVGMKSILKNSDHETVYLCSECNFAYGSTEKLKTHMITAHKLVQRPDDNTINGGNKNCASKPDDNVTNGGNKNRGGKEKLTAAILKKQAKASKKIKCSVKGCDLRFSMDDMRLRHEKCHVEGQKKQFKCFECDSKFSIWRVCSMHMWKCHKVDLGLFTCPMCSVFKASSAGRLLVHMETHEEERPYLCPECGKSFKQSLQLRNHQILHKPVPNILDWSGQQQCDICKKYFANSKSLKKHVQSVHDKFKPFICNICGHKTARKAMLELHLRQHTGEKPHKCPICEYKTGDHNSLRRHIMRHSGDTKYSCPHCSYTSIQSVSYKNHISSKHPGLGGSYFCSLCSYHTVNETAYFNHLVDHRNGLIKDNSNGDDNNEILSKVMKLVEDKSSSNEKQSKVSAEEDDESENYLLSLDHSNDVIDTGGITIPAGAPLNMTY